MTEAGTEQKTNKLAVGILAHVDAGKTTLAENLLYRCGSIGKRGRVDHRDTFLDTDHLERERGITIFSKQAVLQLPPWEITLLDTPGHVDFSAEMERTLQILDYAILVINGADGVQSHSKTLWTLLQRYNLPVFVFVNKMDQPGTDKQSLLEELRESFGGGCMKFGADADKELFYEEIAMQEEDLLERYLEGKLPTGEEIASLIQKRKIFPCFFGSALKDTGVQEFLQGMTDYMRSKTYPSAFGARVFKITRDIKGNRLTHMKITGGSLKVKELLEKTGEDGEEWKEKADQLRIYSGDSFMTIEEAEAGTICAVKGLSKTLCGEGLGKESGQIAPLLAPVLTYGLRLPEGTNPYPVYQKLRALMEEDPLLQLTWQESTGEIQMKVMGEIQTEVLKRLMEERFQLDVEFDKGQIVYKETVEEPVEGVGHYEPLRHYAEVHLLLEPLPRGSGIQIGTDCSEDLLDKNWQRLILTHMKEKQHKGILSGSELTDVKLTLLTGRAHDKHTEGGDFRQATYRAIRQGLRKAQCRLLEPVYEFTLEVPGTLVGRAMTDIQRMQGQLMPPETKGEMTLLTGTCPVATMQEYQSQVAAYTKGLGRLSCRLKGYEPCHNEEEVLEQIGYDPDSDLENPCGSVFCSHGAGFYVDWSQVEDYMHLEAAYTGAQEDTASLGESAEDRLLRRRKLTEKAEISIGTEEIDSILHRTFYANQKSAPVAHKGISAERQRKEAAATVTRVYRGAEKKEPYLLVDGYNVIFAWEDLKELAELSLDGARGKLLDILCNYQAIRGCQLMVVFDAYRLKGHPVEVLEYHNIRVVYTKEAETADQYIEKFAHQNGKKYDITVATSDGLEQIIIRGQGCRLMSSRELLEDIIRAQERLREEYLTE